MSIDFSRVLEPSDRRLVWLASEDGSTALWEETSTDTRLSGDGSPFRLASGKGLEFSKIACLVVEGSIALSSPVTAFCSGETGEGDDFFSSSFTEAGASFLLTSCEGIGIPSFASVCTAVGGTGTALRAGARLGTGGAPCGAGEAVLEGGNGEPVRGGAGEPVLDRLGARGVPARCGIGEETRDGKGAGEATRERGRGGGDVARNAGDVGVSGRGTVCGEGGRSGCETGGSAEIDSLNGLGRGKVISSTGVVNDS